MGHTIALVALFLFNYSLEDTPEENTHPTQGSELTFACRCGEAQCTLLYYTDKKGYPMETTGMEADIRAKLALDPTLYITKNMTFALKKEGRIIAESSVLEFLSSGQ